MKKKKKKGGKGHSHYQALGAHIEVLVEITVSREGQFPVVPFQ